MNSKLTVALLGLVLLFQLAPLATADIGPVPSDVDAILAPLNQIPHVATPPVKLLPPPIDTSFCVYAAPGYKCFGICILAWQPGPLQVRYAANNGETWVATPGIWTPGDPNGQVYIEGGYGSGTFQDGQCK